LVVELVGDGHGGHEVGGAGGTNGEAPLPIGYCGLIRTPHGGEDRIEIAYELLQEFQGRGIATEAADAVLEYAYAAGHRRIWASVREWNTASFRVLQKLGFFDTDERDKNEVHGDSLWMLREWDCEGTGDADHGGSRGRGRPS
jgi:RimJ/RimL family protein N-acetyltransferase